MCKLLILLFIFGLKAQAEVVDVIDFKESCALISIRESGQVELESLVREPKINSNFKGDYEVTLKRINHENETIQIETLFINAQDLLNVCEEFNKDSDDKIKLKALTFYPDKKRNWKIMLTFGPFLAYHHKMDMRINNHDTDAVITDIRPLQRHGLHHYQIIGPNTKPFKFIDEPQNRITLEYQNSNMFLGLEYNHPKILFQDQWATPENNQSVGIHGVIGGEYINASSVALRDYIYQIQASHGNTNINAFAGKIFNLVGQHNKNNLQFHLGAGAGISFANGVTKYFYEDDNGVRKLNITEYEGMKVYGFNLNGKARLQHNFLQGKMNASLTYDGIYTRFDGPLGGFDVEGNLYSHHFGISLGAQLDQLLKSKKKRRK